MSQKEFEVDLTNCEREPIHILGLIQPHGALLAVGAGGKVVFKSDNVDLVLGRVPEIGEAADDLDGFVSETVWRTVKEIVREGDGDVDASEMELGGRVFDVVVHRSDDRTVIEFEPHPDGTKPLYMFALDAQKAISRLTRVGDIDQLLADATREVFALTGFDRVMCYRFRHDAAGEVVAEERKGFLEPFLGLRYPASDIPEQARRLYTVNLLRFISDVDSVPSKIVPDAGPGAEDPLDLSQAVLRHVSPIHVEYLQNMGVKASMSVSIVVGGKLWGLFACHHYGGAKRVPHVVRASCTLLAQMFSTRLEQLLSEERMETMEDARRGSDEYIRHAMQAEDIFGGIYSPELLGEILECDGGAVVFDRQLLTFGEAPEEGVIADLVAWLKEKESGDMVTSHHLRGDFAEVGSFGSAGGMLGVRFSREQSGWVFWFRRVEKETVRWAGNPDKVYKEGKFGKRLSPRGSFEEYLQTVEAQARPWTDVEVEIASQVRVALQDVALSRLAEMERARKILVASLSHDLRNPLFAINISAQMLSDDQEDRESLGQQISTSSHRMQRLIDQMLDFNRIESGQTLGVKPVLTDVGELTRQLIAEIERAFPGLAIKLVDQTTGSAYVDPDRLAQVLSNLLSNTRHHGMLGHPVVVTLEGGGDEAFKLLVRNRAEEIPADVQEDMFKGLKRNLPERTRNRRGLGIGLYIVHTVISEHQGTIRLLPYDGYVTFEIELPPAAA